ncbi:MAG: fatty acyl CoA synthetase [Pseudomonadota bacterium]|nr:fatty acyl CoA synthetase [Pseudomonadota bacterium]
MLMPGAQATTPVDSDWILQKLARPAPMRTDFVEVRSSRLLKNPLKISGEYRRPDNDTLVREVRQPYVETTTIRDGQARIERTGRSARTFALSRSPQLAGMQASFGALLSGDAASVSRVFAVASSGSREDWRLALTPKDAAMKAHLADITLYGRGAELRCIETRAAAGDEVQRTLLANAARSLPATADHARIESLCRSGR